MKAGPDHLAELRALYEETNALTNGLTCDASTDCCRFGVTGREPYPTAVEIAELARAIRARGGIPKSRSLPIASERRCPLLSDAGRCLVYDSRPFGCRTFFCDHATVRAMPKKEVTRLARDIADLSSRYAPRDPGARPISRVDFSKQR